MMGEVNLNRFLSLETLSNTPDGAGGFHDVWIEIGKMWADISVRTAGLRETSLNDISQARFKATVRSAAVGSSARPKAGQRFIESGRVFLIDAVTEFDRAGLYLVCWLHEEVAV
jgi:head-tail adaptor